MTQNADYGTPRTEHGDPHYTECDSPLCPCYVHGLLVGALEAALPPIDGSAAP